MGENGKWQLAFWVVTVICGVWLGTLSTNVIANDRIRSDQDSILRDMIDVSLKDNTAQHLIIIGDLREIKTRMGIHAAR